MKTQTPTSTERFAAQMEELRPPPGAGWISMLLWDIIMAVISLFTALAARAQQQQASQDEAGMAPARTGAPVRFSRVGGVGRRAAAGGTNARGRAVVGAAEVDCILKPARCAPRVDHHAREPSPIWRIEAGFCAPDSKNR